MSRSHRHRRSSLTRTLAAHKRTLGLAALVLFAGAGVGAYFVTAKSTPEAHLAKAVALDQRGEWTAAEIELKNALQLDPSNAEARFRLGRIHFAKNDYQSAEKELRLARTHGMTDPELSVLLARSLLALNQPDRVLDEIKELDGAPVSTNATLLALRAQAGLMRGDRDAAEAALADADARSPEAPDTLAVRALLAINSGQPPEQALALVEQALARDEKRADLWIMKADLLRVARRGADEALDAYAKALALDPANIPARLATAQLLLEANQLDKAEAELKHVGKHAPNNVLGRYLSALIDFRRNRLDEANNKLQSVLNAAPNFLPANLLAGIVNLSQGKRETAASHLGKVLDAQPEHALARKLLSASLLGAGKVEQAKSMVANLKPDDNDALLLSLKGNIAMLQGDYQAARRSLERAAQLAPDNPALLRELAASRMGSGDEAGAVAALNQMAGLDAATDQAEVLLVITHLKAKRYDEALQAVATLEKKQPGQPLAHNLRGIVLTASNQLVKARESYLQALKINPGYFPAANNLANLDLADKDVKAARGRFEQVVKHAPNNSRAWLALADLARAENKEVDYLANLEKAARANPKDGQARQLLAQYWLGKRDAGKALSEARAGLDATGMIEFQDLIGGAHALLGDHVNALAAYQKWAEARPDQPQAHFKVAQAQIVTKNPAAALASLDKALALKPDYADAAVSKALLLNQQGRRDEALKIARDLQTRQPRHAAGFLSEAEIRFSGKQFAEAAQLYIKASSISGQGAPLIHAYKALAAAGRQGEGERLLKQRLEAHADDVLVRHQLAIGLLQEKRYPEAAKHYEILVRDNPKDVVALNNQAWLMGELKHPDALRTAEKAYKLAPKNAAILDTYGWQLTLAGQAQRGLPLLREALAANPENAEIRWHLASALDKAGEKNEALKELDRLLTSGMEFSQQDQARALLRQLRSNTR